MPTLGETEAEEQLTCLGSEQACGRKVFLPSPLRYLFRLPPQFLNPEAP